MSETATQAGRQSFGRNVAQVFFGLALAPLSALATAPLLARALSSDGRGEVAAATAPILVTTAIFTFGVGEAGTYYLARNRHRNKSLALKIVLAFAFMGLLAALVTYLAADFLSDGNHNLANLIRLTAILTLPTFLVYGLRSISNGLQAFDIVAKETLILSLSRLVLITVLFVTDTLTVLTAVLVVMGTTILSGVLHLASLRRLPLNNAGSHPRYADLWGYGHRIWLGSLSGIVLSRVDQLFMVNLSSEAQLGIYVVAVSIGELPSIVAAAVRSVVFSADAAGYSAEDKDSEATSLRLQQVCRLTTFFTLLTAVPMIIVLPWALPLIFGSEYRDAYIPAVILILATVVGSSGSVAGSGLSARGRPGLRSWSMFYGAICNLAVLLTTAPHLGATGAALATFVGSLIAGHLNIIWLSAKFGMPLSAFYLFNRSDFDLIRRIAEKALGGRFGTRLNSARTLEADLEGSENSRADTPK